MATTRFQRTILSTLLLAGLLTAGCGGPAGPKTVPVSGVVQLDGQPLEGATVSFLPKASGARPATATTDAQGKFTLGTFALGDGAVPGPHSVIVTKIKGVGVVGDKSSKNTGGMMLSGPNAGKVEYITPKKYSTRETSGLSFEVKAGMQPVTLELSSK
jgi:hypothetical protein